MSRPLRILPHQHFSEKSAMIRSLRSKGFLYESEPSFLAFGGMIATSSYEFLEKCLLTSLELRALGPAEPDAMLHEGNDL